MFLTSAWHIMTSPSKTTAIILATLPYIFLYLAASADPGYITPSNHSTYMSLYPYDHTLYHPRNSCKTCHLLKPARSKHCSVCKSCIAKLDHHCIFINGCVGYGNLHWFLLLLLTTASLLFYGAFLGFSLLSLQIGKELPGWTFFGTELSWSEYFTLWGYAIQRDVGIGCSTLLAFLTCPLVFGLFFYHIYLIWAGTSTNESLKWGDWRDEMREGYVFKRTLAADRQKDPRFEALETSWPAESRQVLVRTNDHRPPGEDLRDLPGVGPWLRVMGLADVDNLYDLGFWDNLADVFRSANMNN